MAKNKDTKPRPLEDSDLDETSGGLIGLLLPAVQKVRQAAANVPEQDISGGLAAGPHVKSADGSV